MAENIISKEEKAILKQFRAQISDLISTLGPKETHDFNLLRWLRARDLNVENAEKMLRKSISWRQENNVDELSKDLIWDEKLLTSLPLRLGLRDKDGTLVAIIPFGRWDLKAMIKDGYEDKMLQYILKYLEIFSKHMQSLEKDNIQTQATIVFDLEQFSLKQVMSQQAVRFIVEFLKLFDANYPERMKAAFIVSVPKIFEIFWPMVYPILSPRTLSKIHVFGGGPDQWRSKLRENIGSDELPSDFGGSNTTQHFMSNRLGLSIFSLPRAPFYAPEDLIPVDVSAGSKFTRSFDLVVGNRITWNFQTDVYDIGFEFTHKGKPMFPYAKVDSHVCVQVGLVDVNEDGVYTLVFDNSYSRYRSKRLHLLIDIDGKDVFQG
ncbi:unnamed protein product [Allacma fusca]|uniref:SEC14-like protein 2 n=1 Tax=Allacma fusca TaxID=39272 RepID=A0A8J2K1Y2_9HEXA|nr:unnamed protein product [Allacma fusca]